MIATGRRVSVLTALLAAGAALACASGGVPATRAVPFPPAGAPVAEHIQGVFTDEVALSTIAARLTRDFKFPPIEATVVFLPTREVLEAELLAAGYDPTFARDAARRMRAVTLHRRVLVNSAEFSTMTWTSRVGTLAHELVHVLQYDLAGGRRGTSEQWLREGLAEWVALDVLGRIGAVAPGAARRFLEDEFAASRRDQAPRFDDMMTFRQWVDLAGRPGIAPHVQAVLAVDLLVDRHGLPAILDYFRRFEAREDPEGNFTAAFGQDRAAFERDVDARLGVRR